MNASVLRDMQELLVFELASGRYAIRTAAVLEVVRAVSITHLPRALPFVEGVLNVRGRLVPVLEIRDRFGIARRPLGLTDHLVLVKAHDTVVALRVDAATEVVHVPKSAIDDGVVAGRTDQLEGVAKLEDGLVVIFDVESFLSQTEAAALVAALQSVRPESLA